MERKQLAMQRKKEYGEVASSIKDCVELPPVISWIFDARRKTKLGNASN
jgi:hypothetical protein